VFRIGLNCRKSRARRDERQGSYGASPVSSVSDLTSISCVAERDLKSPTSGTQWPL
jgi:hypothetical protein